MKQHLTQMRTIGIAIGHHRFGADHKALASLRACDQQCATNTLQCTNVLIQSVLWRQQQSALAESACTRCVARASVLVSHTHARTRAQDTKTHRHTNKCEDLRCYLAVNRPSHPCIAGCSGSRIKTLSELLMIVTIAPREDFLQRSFQLLSLIWEYLFSGKNGYSWRTVGWIEIQGVSNFLFHI